MGYRSPLTVAQPWQRAWLDELRRVLRPGGYLLCTVHGEYYINSMLNNENRLKLQREGNLTLDAKNPRTSYSSPVSGSWDVFQSRDEILNAFGRNFELLCYEREAVGGRGTAQACWFCVNANKTLLFHNNCT